MDLKQLLFSFDGEIDRQDFWKGIVAIAAFGAVAVWLANALGTEYSPNMWVGAPAWLIGAWMFAAVGAKRCRDRARSPWAVAFVLVPIIGALWYLIELGFLPHRIAPPMTAAQRIAHTEGPFLTQFGWFCVGLFSLQAVFFALMLADAWQRAHRYGDYSSRDVEVFKVLFTGFSIICTAGIAWSRWRTVNSRS